MSRRRKKREKKRLDKSSFRNITFDNRAIGKVEVLGEKGPFLLSKAILRYGMPFGKIKTSHVSDNRWAIGNKGNIDSQLQKSVNPIVRVLYLNSPALFGLLFYKDGSSPERQRILRVMFSNKKCYCMISFPKTYPNRYLAQEGAWQPLMLEVGNKKY
ncbi:hypothetical protein CEXT_626351 [Caerostris extrusa]|uniref:Uncharacterized protein n=1 Tax=Caerostris extrusa TaxID=172846 RepID=A0AAV4W7U9_CAEEX|nr:hypothetical protein CEXT_626351 [Caerostris extrusa]